MTADVEVRIVAAGDAALLVEFPQIIDPVINDRAVQLARYVAAERAGIIRDIVVGYASVTVYFDPRAVDATALEHDLRHRAGQPALAETIEGAVIDVPVCYGGDFGPDLAEVAAALNTTEAEVVALHCAPTYRVYMIGFMPGFPYMARVHPRLALPRKRSPRTRVPAGSVAIAAGQTGIYPGATPGGWHLLGRTSLKPFDESRDERFRFAPGNRVRFHPVDREEFERTARWD